MRVYQINTGGLVRKKSERSKMLQIRNVTAYVKNNLKFIFKKKFNYINIFFNVFIKRTISSITKYENPQLLKVIGQYITNNVGKSQ